MNKFYFALSKQTKELFSGMKGQVGFSKIGDLKRSITYKNQYYRSNKTKDDYDYYCLDTTNMIISEITK